MSNKPEYSIFDPAEIPCKEISDLNALVKEPLVSVKMITYNHASYMAQAIQGVLQQETNFPFELVIGEDCSTDGTREIVFEYQKKYPDMIRVITSEQNVGATKNGYCTEKACRGKYIAYCEGDDYWHYPLKLQKQVDYLESHPDVGLVHGDVDLFNVSTGERIRNLDRHEGRRYTVERDNLFASILERKYHITTLTVCVRRDLLIQVVDSDPIVFQHGRFSMGDVPRWLELSRITNFKYINKSLGTYNVLAESASHSQDGCKVYEFYLSILDMIQYYYVKYSLSFDISQRVSRYHTLMLKEAFFRRDAVFARKTLAIMKRLNWQQQLLYLGATSRLARCILYPFARLARSFRYLKRRYNVPIRTKSCLA